jgi:hypothetical protein
MNDISKLISHEELMQLIANLPESAQTKILTHDREQRETIKYFRNQLNLYRKDHRIYF